MIVEGNKIISGIENTIFSTPPAVRGRRPGDNLLLFLIYLEDFSVISGTQIQLWNRTSLENGLSADVRLSGAIDRTTACS
jgi:hypothetical protein